MANALTGNKIKDSYQALLKIGTNGSLDPTVPITISDGLGNNTPLQLAANKLLTYYGGAVTGLNLDFANNAYKLGSLPNNSIFTIDSNSNYAQILLGGNEYLLLQATTGIFRFGNFNSGTGLRFQVASNEFLLKINNKQYITIQDNANYFSVGDNFKIEFNNGSDVMQSFINNSPKGFKFDNYFGLGDYYFGDYNGISGNGYININPAFGIMSINAENLYFSGFGLESATSGGFSGKHLVISLNGTFYKIKLENV